MYVCICMHMSVYIYILRNTSCILLLLLFKTTIKMYSDRGVQLEMIYSSEKYPYTELLFYQLFYDLLRQ